MSNTEVKRTVIQIDTEKCNGCGLCASACQEGAIGMRDGKAVLLREDYCDGLGNCLPACPTGAIRFEEREAEPFNEAAAKAAQQTQPEAPDFAGCPGTRSMQFAREQHEQPTPTNAPEPSAVGTQLRQWPVQIKLVPVNAPYFHNANLLVAADCAAYAFGNFHTQFMKNKITVIGCPKLDDVDYSEKLTQIISQNNIKSVTVVRMEVPCCGGIEYAVKTALQNSGKMIPWQVVTISTDGQILED